MLENEDLEETTTMRVTSEIELLKWIFDLTYCEWGGSHFVLDSRPIGLGATGGVAIIYMEDLKLRDRSKRERVKAKKSSQRN